MKGKETLFEAYKQVPEPLPDYQALRGLLFPVEGPPGGLELTSRKREEACILYPLEVQVIPISFEVSIPEDEPQILVLLPFGLTARTYDALIEGGATELAELLSVVYGSRSIPRIGPGSKRQIRTALEALTTVITKEQLNKGPETPIIIGPPFQPTEKDINDFLAVWSLANPSGRGALLSAATYLSLTKEGVNKILGIKIPALSFLEGEITTPISFDPEELVIPSLPENWPPFTTLDTEEGIKQIDYLDLPVTAQNALSWAQKTNIAELIPLADDELRAIRNIGKKRSEEILLRLEFLRLLLREKQEEMPKNLPVLVFTKEGFSIQPGPLLDSIELPEPIEIPAEKVIPEEIVEEEVTPAIPAYQFELPKGEEDLTELESLVRLGLLNNLRIFNLLKRGSVTDIARLARAALGVPRVRLLGKKSKIELGRCLEEFHQLVSQLQEEQEGEGPIIINVPLLTPDERVIRALGKRHYEVTKSVADCLSENLNDPGCFEAAAKQLGITTKRVYQIIHAFNEARAQKILDFLGLEHEEQPISIFQIANQLQTTPQRLIELLREGEISLGDREIDDFYITPPFPPKSRLYHQFKLVFPSLLAMKELKKRFEPPPPKEKTVEEIMQSLKLWRAESDKVTFPPLYNLVQEVIPGVSRQEIPAIHKDLTEAGFHLRRFKGGRGTYYFAHTSEREGIITTIQGWPEERYGRPKIFTLGQGPEVDEAAAITTFEFVDIEKFRSPFRMLRELVREKTGSSFHPRHYSAILRYIVARRLTTVPILCYPKPEGNSFKIRQEDLQGFEDEISTNEKAIISFLEELKKSPS